MQSHESHTSLKPGVCVEVTDGLAKGRIGTVREQWPRHWDEGIPLWRVRFTGELIRDRILREDYLRVVGT